MLIFWGERSGKFWTYCLRHKAQAVKGSGFPNSFNSSKKPKLPLQLLNIIVAEVILKQKMIDAQFCFAPATGDEL